MPSFSPSFLLLIAGIVAFGGVVKGVAGFGYAIASTALLANVLEPSTAVVLMILPMLVANVGLLGQLRWRKIVSCLHRFWPYIVLTMVGTILGMVLLDRVPTAALTVGIGLFTLLYVAGTQSWVSLPGEDRLVSYCFRPGSGVMAALGLISGFVFGVSNVAVQVVAYLDSLSLDRGTFIGVLAMILVGISGVRIGLAWGLGMYESGGLLLYSAMVSVPGVLGVALGSRLRRHIPTEYEQAGVMILLTIIGIRLVTKGL